MSYIAYVPWSKHFDITLEMLEWAKEHCPSYITNDSITIKGEDYYRFYFKREQECLFFTLKWL